MGKIRVYELAKEAGVESKTLTAQLIELGYNVRAYNSTLEDDMAEEIRTRLGFKKVDVQEKRIESKGRTTIIRRRTQAVPDLAEEIPEKDAAEGLVQEPQIEPEVALKQQSSEPTEQEAAPLIGEKLIPEVAADSFEGKELAESTVGAEDKEGKQLEPPLEAEPPVAADERIPENQAGMPQREEDVVPESAGAPAAPGKVSTAGHEPLEPMLKEAEIAKSPDQIPQGEPELKTEEITSLPKRKKGLAKIIGRTELPLPVDETKLRAKKIEKPKKPKVVVASGN